MSDQVEYAVQQMMGDEWHIIRGHFDTYQRADDATAGPRTEQAVVRIVQRRVSEWEPVDEGASRD